MSRVLGQLCAQLVGDAFGPVAQSVTQYLFSAGSRPLPALLVASPYSGKQVRLALQVLLLHDLVVFSAGKTSRAEYRLLPDKVLLLLRYPRYLLLVKTRFGDEPEVLLDELLRQGQETAFNIIVRAVRRINISLEGEGKTASPAVIRDKFLEMVRQRYFRRCAKLAAPPDTAKEGGGDRAQPADPVTSSDGVPTFEVLEGDQPFAPPSINMAAVVKAVQSGSDTLPPAAVNDVRWQVNFSKLDEEFRDQIVLNSVSRTCGEPAADVMRHAMQLTSLTSQPWAPRSNPFSLIELKDRLSRLAETVHPEAVKYAEQYIRLMSEGDSPYLSRFGDAGGGQYVLNMQKIYQNFSWTAAENVVEERFGSRAGRIFRLLREKKYIEQDKIHEWAMIPAKEAKLLTYQLHQAAFVNVCDLRKPGQQTAPGKVAFLFRLDSNHLTRMMIEFCYRTLVNMLVSREFETTQHTRLRDKQQRIESIVATLREQGAEEQQLADVEEMLTEPERRQLDHTTAVTKKLSSAEIQLDQTLFILLTSLRYSLMK